MPRSAILLVLALVAASSDAFAASEEAALAQVRAHLASHFDEIVQGSATSPAPAVAAEKRDLFIDFYIRALTALPDDGWTEAFTAKAIADTADVIRRARSHLEDPPDVLRQYLSEEKLAKVVKRLTRPAPAEQVAEGAARRERTARTVADAIRGCVDEIDFAVAKGAIPAHVAEKAADLDLGAIPRDRLVERYLRQYLGDVVDALRDTKLANIAELKDNLYYASEVVDSFAKDAPVDRVAAKAVAMAWLATYRRPGDGPVIYDLPDAKFVMLQWYDHVLKQCAAGGGP